MKLISWNVNGIRAAINKGFLDFLEFENPDVLCLQEIKAERDQVDFGLNIEMDYHIYFNSAVKKGYSGTAIFSKKEPLSVTYGIGIEEHDQEGRVICAEYDEYYVITVYTPNSKRDLLRLDYRMIFEDEFKNYLKNLELHKPVIVCGDLNVAHKEIDLKNPKTNTKNAGFTIEEREKFQNLLDSGFIDTFRYFNKDLEDAYTWWSYMATARERNIGWRIDYFLVSDVLKSKLKSANILNEVLGSDHCPVTLVLKEEK